MKYPENLKIGDTIGICAPSKGCDDLEKIQKLEKAIKRIVYGRELKKEDLDIYIQKIRKRNMVDNIQVNNMKQFVKKLILRINIKLYLKLK